MTITLKFFQTISSRQWNKQFVSGVNLAASHGSPYLPTKKVSALHFKGNYDPCIMAESYAQWEKSLEIEFRNF
jgi:hypothetical protein